MFRHVLIICLVFTSYLTISAQSNRPQCRTDDEAFAYHLEKGAYFRGRTDYDESLWHYNCAIDIDEQSIPALRGRAETLMAIDTELGAAGRELDKLLELAPNNLEALVLRGDVFRLVGDLEEAQSLYSQVIALDANHAAAYIGRGHIFARELRVNEAVADYETAASLGYEPAYLPYIFMGDVYRATGRPDNAATSYYRATIADPDHAESYLLLAQARTENGDIVKAQEDFRRYAELVDEVPPNVQRELIALTLREVVLRFSPTIVFIGLSLVLIASYVWKKPENPDAEEASAVEQTALTTPQVEPDTPMSPVWWIAPVIGIGVLGFLGRFFGKNDR